MFRGVKHYFNFVKTIEKSKFFPCVQQCKYILEIVTKNSMAMHVSAFYKVYKKIVILEWYNSNFNKVLFFSPKIVPFLFLHTLLELLVFELQCTKSQNN